MARGRLKKFTAALAAALAAGLLSPTAAFGQTATKAFDPQINIEVCDNGKFPTASTVATCTGSRDLGAVSDIRLRISEQEGEPLLASGKLTSTGIALPPGTAGANYDKVGEGKVSINAIQPAFGVVSPMVCLVNQNPPDPGDHDTVLAIVNIGSSQPCNPNSNPPPTVVIKLRIQGEGTTFNYFLDLGSGLGGGDIKLGTPLDLDVVFYGTSQPNTDVKPNTPGGTTIVKLPTEPGEYKWSGDFADASGTKVTKTSTIVLEKPPEPKHSSPLIPILVIAGIVILLIIAYVLWSRSNKKKLGGYGQWDYYDEYGDEYGGEYGGEYGYEEGYYDESRQGAGGSYDQGYGQEYDDYR